AEADVDAQVVLREPADFAAHAPDIQVVDAVEPAVAGLTVEVDGRADGELAFTTHGPQVGQAGILEAQEAADTGVGVAVVQVRGDRGRRVLTAAVDVGAADLALDRGAETAEIERNRALDL